MSTYVSNILDPLYTANDMHSRHDSLASPQLRAMHYAHDMAASAASAALLETPFTLVLQCTFLMPVADLIVLYVTSSECACSPFLNLISKYLNEKPIFLIACSTSGMPHTS